MAHSRRQGLHSIPSGANSQDGTLDLRDNVISSLESGPWQRELRRLYLGRNAFRSIELSQQLQHLEVLDLSDNKLQTLQVGLLSRLQYLNLAGNDFACAEAIEGLHRCSKLRALDLSRNFLENCPLNFLQQLSSLQLLDLLGNPHRPSDRVREQLPNLLIWNGHILSNRENEAASLRSDLPPELDFLILDRQTASGQEPQERRTTQDSRAVHGSASASGAADAGDPQVSAQEFSSMHPRRSSGPVMDSADDMTSGRTSNSSGSQANLQDQGSSPNAQASHLGLVERQDSANYQPRPPALAERQDSAQVLQALAEEEAALTQASGGLAETPVLARQDSARDLGEVLRSPSPGSRRAASPRIYSSVSLEPSRAPHETNFASHAISAPSDWLSAQRQSSAGLELCVTPREDSANDRLGHRGSGVLDRVWGESDVDRSPRQDLQNARPSSHAEFEINATTQRAASTVDALAHPLQQTVESAHQEGAPGGRALRSNSLTEARQLVLSMGSPSAAHPSTASDQELESQTANLRQDSALDTLSEARRVVLADVPHSEYPSVSSSDPLQQARKLFQETMSSSSSPRSISRIQAPPTAERLSFNAQEKPLLRARSAVGGPLSPFEGALTPLSPAWTASQLQPSFMQQLPSIESGLPWTFSNTASSGITSGTPSAMENAGSLLSEARRVVLGSEAATKTQASSSTSGTPSGTPSKLQGVSGKQWICEPHPTVKIGTGGASHSGKISRETPYPDSPLAAPTAAEHGASLQVRALSDVAGPSQ